MTGFVSIDRAAGRRLVGRRGAIALLASVVLGAVVAGCSGASITPETIYRTVPPTATPITISTVEVAPAATPAPTDTPAPTPTPTPKPTPAPAIGACNASNLSLTIKGTSGIYWQGGGGHQMATFILKNNGSVACNVKAQNQPLFLNGNGSILILGAAAGTSSTLKIAAHGSVHADVQTGNLCNAPAIVAPTKVAFMMAGGTGLVMATPLSSSDEGGVPPCLGDPSIYSGSIEAQPWAP